jgi:hypothetical protein
MSIELSDNKKLRFVLIRSISEEYLFFSSDGTIFGLGNPLLDIIAEVPVSFLET